MREENAVGATTISIITLGIMTLSTAMIKNKTKNAVGTTTISIMTLDTMTLGTAMIKKRQKMLP